MNLTQISVVVPVYNDQASIIPFLKRTQAVLEKIGTYEIIFCVDPSADATEAVIEKEIVRNPNVRLLVFSRRFGQPAATMAGIQKCHGEVCVVIDVDLQDPPEVIPELYAKYREGFEVVYGKRSSRRGETLIKKTVASLGYRFIHSISQVKIPKDAGDFRLLGPRAIEELRHLPEANAFLRGLVGFIGFKQTSVDFDRQERAEGEGKYNRYFGSLKIGFNGIVCFSSAPLSAILFGGIALSMLSCLALIGLGVARIIDPTLSIGIPSLIAVVFIASGIQLLSVGILGEYIGRIYDEVKHRPRYIIDRAVNWPKETRESKIFPKRNSFDFIQTPPQGTLDC